MNTNRNKNQRGQSLVEYVALTALVAIVSIGTVKLFGSKVKSRLNQVTNTFDRNIQQGLKAKVSRETDNDNEDGENSALPSGVRLPKGFPRF